MKEILIKDIENIKIGNAENKEAGTGCTVIICENGAPVGLDVRAAEARSDLMRQAALCNIWRSMISAMTWV
jgi:L-aminopeptidase/D-esterase-like protein